MATVAEIVVKLLYLLKQKIDPHIFYAVEVFGAFLRFQTLIHVTNAFIKPFFLQQMLNVCWRQYQTWNVFEKL